MDNNDDKEIQNVNRYFDTVYKCSYMNNNYAREYETAVHVLLGAKPEAFEIIRKEIAERKM